MDTNQCPTCKAELAGNQECANCAGAAQLQPGIAAASGPELLDQLRNVRPLIQTPENPEKNNAGEKQPGANEAQPKIPSPGDLNDPGLSFFPKELRDFPTFAKRIKQEANKRRGGKSHTENRAAGRDYAETYKTQIDQIKAYFGDSRERRADVTAVSLMEVTIKLPEREPQIPERHSYRVDPHLGRLRDQHVLFMSCVDEAVALGAAYALLDHLRITDEQRFLLNFPRGSEKSDAVIELFTQLPSEERAAPTAIVIDGFNPEARAFLDWLQSSPLTLASAVRSHLQRHGFFLLCLVDPEYLQKYSSAQRFATWSVPFLRPLLMQHFPLLADALEKEILVQQQSGKWKQTDAEFCNEIRALLDNDLQKAVEQRRNIPIIFTPPTPDPPLASESLFKGGHSIEDTLLYAATYFSDIPPHEFDQLVDWLLADRTTTVTVKTQHHNSDGTIQTIETEIQKPLRDFWNADPDSYLITCEIEASTGPNLTTSIRFANETKKQKLKTHLEKNHSMYLLRQFRILESNKFLTSAPNISDRAMSLSLDMAMAYPGSFGKEWLLNLIVDARNGSKFSPNSDNATVTFGKNKALERITLFVRLMLERPQLDEVVNGLLKDLMSLGSHETVLFLVRGLQFAPGFDAFYWMKRLLDEGEKNIKDGTYDHLYSYIQKIGIYPLLSKVEPWIPDDSRPFDNYSPSCIYSLRLLLEYCSNLTETFDREQAPFRHPLFTFTDEAAARANFGRLIGWFFHPGMPTVFADLETAADDDGPETRVLPFICELVLEWIVVLRELDSSSQNNSAASEQFLSAARTQDALIESLATIPAPNQRNQILLYWERLRDFMGLIVNLSDGSMDWFGSLTLQEKRAMLGTRRDVKDLIKRFRTAIRAEKQRNAKVLTTV